MGNFNWSTLCFEILAGRHYAYDNSWAGHGKHRMMDDFDRLYIVEEGEAFVREEGGGVTHVTPGRLCLFPGGSVARYYHCPSTMTLSWLHFRIEAIPGISLFSHYAPPSSVKSANGYPELLRRLIKERDKNTPVGNVTAAGILCQLVSRFIPDSWEEVFPCFDRAEQLRPALVAIGQNPAKPLDLKAVAKSVSLHPVYFASVFKKTFGVSPARQRKKILMRKAKAMLEAGSLSVKDVAAACGYDDPLYFSKSFSSFTGVSPKEYKKLKGRIGP